MNEIYHKGRIYLIWIGIYQGILLLSVFFILYMIANFEKNNPDLIFASPVILYAAAFGFMGSIINFFRKTYVYLITHKFKRVLEEQGANPENNSDHLKEVINGYCLYLIFRPFAGLVIGPVVYMLAFTGLLIFVKQSINVGPELTIQGRYLIYIVAFVGGHASSEILDYFSRLAKKIVVDNDD